MSKLAKDYTGLQISAGVDYLKDGYADYATEVIVNRALPSLYDGMKPVNRRILYTLYKDKVIKNYMKSMRIAGNVLALHPHGDQAVYKAMVLMTDDNGSMQFPVINGHGNFGGVYKTDPPAAPRYTEARLLPQAMEYFGEMSGIDMIDNFDSTLKEPAVLPVSFPAVLVNANTGIAVGFRSNTPSFNFVDVCNLVIEYIKNGRCSTVIEPDFVTGGIYVRNEGELRQLMATGKARLKLRARIKTEGKQLIVTEVPYGKTIQLLIRQINNLEDRSIKNAYDVDDFNGAGIKINCTSANFTEQAYYTLLRYTDLQYSYSADMTVIDDGKPKRLGVWQIIKRWTEWRKGVVLKELSAQRKALLESIREANAFMAVVNAYDKRMELVRLIADSGKKAGSDYIRSNFTRDEVPADLIDFCASRSLPSYHDGGKYADIVANGRSQLDKLNESISNIGAVIISQMEGLIAKYGSKLTRRTEVTSKDYEFVDTKSSVVVDDKPCVFEVSRGFIKKLRIGVPTDATEFMFDAKSNDTLIAFDNRGRILRINGSDIVMDGSPLGTYIPTYAGLKETDDYRITYIGVLDGSELFLLYKDGNIGYVDTSEWDSSKRNVKVLNRGISSSSAEYLGAVLHKDEISDVLFVTDVDGNVGWVNIAKLAKKGRTAKTRAVKLRKNALLDTYFFTDSQSALMKLKNPLEHNEVMRPLRSIEDYLGDLTEFISM